jgi:hypothetical protein
VVVEYTLFGDRADGTYNAIDPRMRTSTAGHVRWARGGKSPVSLKIQIPCRFGLDRRTQLATRQGERGPRQTSTR